MESVEDLALPVNDLKDIDYFSKAGEGEKVVDGLPAELRIPKGAALFHGTPFGNDLEEFMSIQTENQFGGYFMTPNFRLAEYYAHRFDGVDGIKPTVFEVQTKDDLRLIDRNKALDAQDIQRLVDVFVENPQRRLTILKDLSTRDIVSFDNVRLAVGEESLEISKRLIDAGYSGEQYYSPTQGLEIMLYESKPIVERGKIDIPENKEPHLKPYILVDAPKSL